VFSCQCLKNVDRFTYYFTFDIVAKSPFWFLSSTNHVKGQFFRAVKGEGDFLEAFSHHPKIGDISSLIEKFTSTAHLAVSQQGSVTAASEEVLQGLAKGNADCEQKFGFIFIVCATGKSAAEMLELLQNRIPYNGEIELQIAACEQTKITRIRLGKLLA
jgi:2-oxo-4-hydroxy-4-carboxy-5-ureidoimidazoline decarboxylase